MIQYSVHRFIHRRAFGEENIDDEIEIARKYHIIYGFSVCRDLIWNACAAKTSSENARQYLGLNGNENKAAWL